MTGPEFGRNPNEQAIMLGENLARWHARVDDLIAQDARIITLRGAGTVNGIEPSAAASATSILHDYITDLTAEGRPVAIMFDGDDDNREKPDVGSVFGGLVDALKDNPRVTAICAQTKSWYYPKTEGGALTSASGTPYETYVFGDNVPGGHASLTQSETLARYPGYEQVFVGPAGKIAYDQLQDLSRKASGEPVKVSVLKIPLNPDPAIDTKLWTQLEGADDGAKRAAIQDKLAQRKKLPYGALFTESGDLSDEVANMPGIRLAVLLGSSAAGELA